MEVNLPEHQTYIVAVSGGVDSMVLLDLIIKSHKDWQIVVAHVDHGIRPDSHEDRELVKKIADANHLIFETTELKLGPKASENLAREKRYEFLNVLKNKYQAAAIVTAHQQDDLLETAILNIIRGTGRRGLTAIMDSQDRLRPLLTYPKADIKKFATDHNIPWREDSTNQDVHYLRNYIRLKIMPRFNTSARLKLLDIINKTKTINDELDQSLGELIKHQAVTNELDRAWFSGLSHALAKEVMATWLRFNNLNSFSSLTLERLVVSAKVAKVGQSFPVFSGNYLVINNNSLSLSLL